MMIHTERNLYCSLQIIISDPITEMIYLCLYPVLIIQSQDYKMVCLISATDNIYPAKNFLQLQTDKLQEPVTCILSKQIIDKLKIFNIDIDNSGICLRMLLQKFPASPVKSFFIKKPGQFIRLELEKIFGRIDIVSSRYEADHFVILTLDNEERIQAKINHFCNRIRDYYLKTTVEISAGIYEIRDRSKSLRIMCDRAHLAADSIKKNHMIQVAVYDDTHRKKLIQEQMIINELDDALKEKQFKAFFQPKYDMCTDRVIGAEALVRWEHPEKGLLPPGIFIPVLEKNGYIAKVDLYIYEETCIFLKKCMDEGIPLHPVSVNLSRVGFYNPNLFQTLCEIAERYQIPRKYLELEITETAYATDSEMIFSVVEKLRQGGFRILMDDFGSGYSSLNMLKEAPVDEIKLDMRFLSAADPYGRAEETGCTDDG